MNSSIGEQSIKPLLNRVLTTFIPKFLQRVIAMKQTDDKPIKALARSVPLLCAALFLTMMGNLIECMAQGRQQPQPNRPPTQPLDEPGVTSALAEVKEDYRIHPGDVIEIQIDRATELSGVFRVTASGAIDMYYLGRINVQNKTQEELSRFIADGLRGRYLKIPRVKVIIVQINSHVFFIQGSVNRPGAYQIEGRPSLLTLITVAGGLKENHGSTAFIIRQATHSGSNTANAEPALLKPNQANPDPARPDQPKSSNSDEREEEKYELFRVNINGLFRGDFDKNMFIEPRSIVHIPSAEVFFVAGEVQAPGSFTFKEGTTLRQAISLAQGTTFKAASNRGVIFRDDPISKTRLEIKVDINLVMSGKKDDIAIQANDVIIVPNSRFKSASSVLLNAFGNSVARVPGF